MLKDSAWWEVKWSLDEVRSFLHHAHFAVLCNLTTGPNATRPDDHGPEPQTMSHNKPLS